MSVEECPGTHVEGAVKDPYGREVKSLRLSITQRCDLACSHCHREGQSESQVEMTPDEVRRLIELAVSVGVRKVKITGGEPLIRDDIQEIVSSISPLVSEVSLTTNGSRLRELARGLRAAGLRRVNVSLHTLDPRLYESICGADTVDRVVDGIRESVRVGLNPVKVNMVVLKDTNERHITPMIDFCAKAGAVLQLIELETDRARADAAEFTSRYFPLKPVEELLASQSIRTTTNELHRRRRYHIPTNGGTVEVEVVRPMHNTEFCANCTRIRMSSDGLLKPCLLDSGGTVDVLTPLREGANEDDLRVMFMRAIGNRRPYWS